jgi:hypothetical protein
MFVSTGSGPFRSRRKTPTVCQIQSIKALQSDIFKKISGLFLDDQEQRDPRRTAFLLQRSGSSIRKQEGMQSYANV